MTESYKKIKRKKIYEEVQDTLIDMIKNGELKPGEKLPSVEQLADNFQVGRSAIREALTSLRAMNVIEIKHGEGTYVKDYESSALFSSLSNAILLQPNDVMNLLEVRKIVEFGAVEVAAKNFTEEDKEEIQQAIAMMEEELDQPGELGDEADWKFHMSIAKATHNPILIDLVNNISNLMIHSIKETRRLFIVKEPGYKQASYEEHSRICEAIINRDPVEAKKQMEIHLNHVERLLKSVFH